MREEEHEGFQYMLLYLFLHILGKLHLLCLPGKWCGDRVLGIHPTIKVHEDRIKRESCG